MWLDFPNWVIQLQATDPRLESQMTRPPSYKPIGSYLIFDQTWRFWQDFTVLIRFYNLGHIAQFWPGFEFMMRFWSQFTILTKFDTSFQTPQFWPNYRPCAIFLWGYQKLLPIVIYLSFFTQFTWEIWFLAAFANGIRGVGSKVVLTVLSALECAVIIFFFPSSRAFSSMGATVDGTSLVRCVHIGDKDCAVPTN